jgi:opacity protein-like surface antigen
MRYVVLIACLCFATIAQAAQSAQNANSFYVGGFGGVTFLPDIRLSQAGFGSGDLESDAGFNLGAVMGYKWVMGFRAEGEISYRQNDLDNLDGVPVIGDLSALAFMGNGWFDFHNGTPWIPYVGGGLGVASITLDSGGNDSDAVFAWQIGGGIGYEFLPGIVASVDYRFLATSDPSFEDPGFADIEAEYSSHSINFGIRAHF